MAGLPRTSGKGIVPGGGRPAAGPEPRIHSAGPRYHAASRPDGRRPDVGRRRIERAAACHATWAGGRAAIGRSRALWASGRSSASADDAFLTGLWKWMSGWRPWVPNLAPCRI